MARDHWEADGSAPDATKPKLGRVWPFLAVGVALFTVLAPAPLVLGFLVQDRFHLGAEAGARNAGIALVANGVVSLFTQTALIRWLNWSPSRLLHVGVPISMLAFLTLTIAPNLVVVAVAMALFGLGHGLAVPGYTAAPTFHVAAAGQGRLAGLLSSANGAGSIAGPLLATPLYGVTPAGPFLANAALMAMLAAFVLLHPLLRR